MNMRDAFVFDALRSESVKALLACVAPSANGMKVDFSCYFCALTAMCWCVEC